ncbi:unnamed protein product, partial [Thelazia callipaeda]|uniref:C-type lectin domain-containing protein n=1 Tax=Thelazia callipaeda TaxID=103827 RepID=A0A0N5D2E9_THECL
LLISDLNFIRPFFQNYGTSWISDPEGYYYQFHLSEQSWNMGREYCLTLASDLVIIRSLQQLTFLFNCREWEFTMIDVRMKNTTLDSRAQCALYDIDNRILKSIACGQTPEFDHINRFICQRSYVQYHEVSISSFIC